MVSIELKCKHKCSEDCQYVYVGEDNSYNPETGKCDKFGKFESISPHIASWFEDESKCEWKDFDEIVIPRTKVTIEFDYPLKSNFRFEFQSDNPDGFTRKNLVDSICKKYQEIYDEENASLTVPPTAIEKRINRGGLINRERTDGTYGIWGHDLGDLYLEGMRFYPEECVVLLDVGS